MGLGEGEVEVQVELEAWSSVLGVVLIVAISIHSRATEEDKRRSGTTTTKRGAGGRCVERMVLCE